LHELCACHQIRAKTIHPTAVNTAMVSNHVVEQSAQRNDEDLLPALVNTIPVTGVVPEDISATVFGFRWTIP
jgi:hypothetical protein